MCKVAKEMSIPAGYLMGSGIVLIYGSLVSKK